MSGHSVFTYGTLQIAAIMEAVTGCRCNGIDAALPGYARYRIKRQVFPGIIPMPGAEVAGVLYREIDAAALQLLDFFEDELYERRSVNISTDEGTDIAEAYVVAPPYQALLEKGEWDLLQFRRDHLQRYLRSCRRFYRQHAPRIKQSGMSAGR